MTKEERILYYKEEFIKRYKYLYENSQYILAPFMYQETKEEVEERNKKLKDLDIKYDKNRAFISLKIDRDTLIALEDFLLSDGKMEENSFFKKIEYLKGSNQHFADVLSGLSLLAKKNVNLISFFQDKLDLWRLLKEVRFFVLDQSGDVKNKRLKLETLDEYFRVYRYSNDGKVWTSGFDLTVHDVCNYDNFSMGSSIGINKEMIPKRDRNDIGICNNGFINFFGNTAIFKSNNNAFHFSEKEKQDIYLMFHDELPWDLKIYCLGERLEPSRSLEVGYPVLNTPNCCGSIFTVKEDDIFIDDSEDIKFYQLCPECGYMVHIPKEIINDGVQKRIVSRHKESVKQLKK